MLGRKVAAHAHTPAGMNDAIRAGVASIEHGSLIDDEGIRLMKEHGTFLVPSLYTLDFIIQEGTNYGVPEYSVEKAKSMAKQQRERLRKAYQEGVRFADVRVPHGRNPDFEISGRAGSPMEAIQMARSPPVDRHRGMERSSWKAGGYGRGGGRPSRTSRPRGRPSMKNGVVYKSPRP
jgi:imidazolonepropionase-like amidohydrolase